MQHINIVGRDDGFGLSRDMDIVARVLRTGGFRVTTTVFGKTALVDRLYRVACMRLLRRRPYDVNLFIEFAVPDLFACARVNCFLGNQEWLRDTTRPYLQGFDHVLCKTRLGEEAFRDLGCKTVYVGFTSLDRRDPAARPDYGACFHLAGGSPQKGTRPLIDVWSRHPEWPLLTVVQNPKNAFPVRAPNVDYRAVYVPDDELCSLQNGHGIHLCPSEMEGFGHYIVEGMSCGAVILTTDAPPMNEIISGSNGVLAQYRGTESHMAGVRYFVDPDDLEGRIAGILSMSHEERAALGTRARTWFEENDRAFRGRFCAFIGGL